MMKILVLSNDDKIIKGLRDWETPAEIVFCKKEAQLWNIMEILTSQTFSIIIVDDDLIKPQSERVIKMIKQLQQNTAVIFITSDTSIVLGKKISQLGIQYYAIKPLENDLFVESVWSIAKVKSKTFN